MKPLESYLKFGDPKDLRRALVRAFLNGEALTPELLDATIAAIPDKKPNLKKYRARRNQLIAIAVSNLHHEQGELLEVACQRVGHAFSLSGETVQDIYQAHTPPKPSG